MLKFLTGLISGIVSGTGMGGGTILILVLSLFMRHFRKYKYIRKWSMYYESK